MNTSRNSIRITNLRSITLISVFSALSIVGRFYMSFIPNVQPSTVLIIIFSLVFGIRFGVILAVITAFGSDLLLGLGPWTIMQIIAWSSVAYVSGLLGLYYKKIPHLIMTIFAGIMGYLFGFIVSLNVLFTAGFYGFVAYYLMGLLFDTYHAAGNLVFYFFLAPILTKLLENQKERYFKDVK